MELIRCADCCLPAMLCSAQCSSGLGGWVLMEGLVTAPPLRLLLPSSTPIWPEALGVLYGSLWISVLKGNGAWLDTAQVRLQVWLPSPRLLDMSAPQYVPNL